MNRKPTAIVIGLDCITGLQTARILAQHGVPVIGMARDLDHYCCQTNVCTQKIAADAKSETFIDLLREMGSTFDQKPVLVPCTDMSVLLISRNREKLQQWYRFALPDHQVVETLMDKIEFYTFAAQAGLPIPETFFLRSRQDVEMAAGKLNYPCILKPPMKSPKWESSTNKKVYKLESAQELLACYDMCSDWADILMVQEWIEGSDANLNSFNGYFDRQSQPLVTFTARKTRQWPPETGTSCMGEEVRNDEVLKASIAMFRSVNYHGLGYVEMKRDDRTGKHYIIEPNIGRPTGRSALAEFAGVELVYTMYCDLAGLPLPENRVQKYRGTRWIYLRRDLQSAFYYWRKGELSLGSWLRSIWGVKKDAVFSWTDLKPALADFGGSTLTMFFGRKRKKTQPEKSERERTAAA